MIQRRLHQVCRLDVVGRGVWIRSVVIVCIELNSGDVLFKEGHGDGAGKLLAPAPYEIQAFAKDGREGIDVLVPSAIEVAEEQQIVILEVFLHLGLAQEREAIARQDNPAGKFDEGQVNQVLSQRLYVSEQEEKAAKNPGLPRLHGRDGIHRVDFAVDVAHWTSDM